MVIAHTFNKTFQKNRKKALNRGLSQTTFVLQLVYSQVFVYNEFINIVMENELSQRNHDSALNPIMVSYNT